MQTVTIKQRFCGPPTSGNGGYSCGILAKNINGPAKVRLHSPPPLDTALMITEQNDSWHLRWQEQLIGTATSANLTMTPPTAPSLEQARQARDSYVGLEKHVFASCFVCGRNREEHDGLRLFTGAIDGTELVASDWQPEPDFLDESGHVKAEFVWSALDCPSFWALRIPLETGKVCLLGEMTASIDYPVPGNQPLIVYAWKRAIEGRKHFCAAALANTGGKVLARAEHLWIAIN
jgi:hypothetical protein|tara:strand:- start:528 stop:1229 length:702 start_codon:yes stop_codon:yes gene_type:complete